MKKEDIEKHNKEQITKYGNDFPFLYIPQWLFLKGKEFGETMEKTIITTWLPSTL